MQRYLVYDAGCSVCSHLASTIEEAVAGKLTAISIHGEQAKALLDRAYPEGWTSAPYVVTVKQGRVNARTGFSAATQLGALMGPRKAWRVWSLARRSGILLPPRTDPKPTSSASRRGVLKLGAALTAAVGIIGVTHGRYIPGAAALYCEMQCQCLNCYLISYYCSSYCSPETAYRQLTYQCFDQVSGLNCGYRYGTDCNCFVG